MIQLIEAAKKPFLIAFICLRLSDFGFHFDNVDNVDRLTHLKFSHTQLFMR